MRYTKRVEIKTTEGTKVKADKLNEMVYGTSCNECGAESLSIWSSLKGRPARLDSKCPHALSTSVEGRTVYITFSR